MNERQKTRARQALANAAGTCEFVADSANALDRKILLAAAKILVAKMDDVTVPRGTPRRSAISTWVDELRSTAD